MDGQVGDVHIKGLGKALGIQHNAAVVAGRDGPDGIQVHSRRQHLAVLMVGVVAHHLGATRRADESHRFAIKMTSKRLGQAIIAFKLILTGVKRVQPIPVLIEQCPDIHTSYPLMPCIIMVAPYWYNYYCKPLRRFPQEEKSVHRRRR